MSITELCYYLFLLIVVANHAAAAGSSVKFLPGFEGPLPFELETGYVGVGDSEDIQLFYYFIKSESNPESDPLIVWFVGGPGCSSLSAITYEFGPILFEPVEYNGSFPKFVLNPYAWTKVANFLFIDSPVGTGFSYARTPAAKHSDDLRATYHAYEFLPNWFVDHQEFLNNPVYVGGESYSGRTVPIITQNIAIHNEMKKEPFINLKGYVLGNPLTYYGEGNYRIPFAHGMGLISDELYESLMTKCNGDYLTPNQSNTFCLQDVETFKELIKEVNNLHILEPKCNPKPHLMFGQRRSLDEKFHQANNPRQLKCREDWYISSNHWGNDAQVQEALNIRKGFIGKWARCRRSVFSYYKRKVTNTIPYHVTLSSKGYRFLIYSGDHDKQVPFQSTIAWIKSLNYSVVDEWRPWFVDDQVAGLVLDLTHCGHLKILVHIIIDVLRQYMKVKLFQQFQLHEKLLKSDDICDSEGSRAYSTGV
ncbi:hypothetical protein P3S68_027159 [Capsicum galapagoense]